MAATAASDRLHTPGGLILASASAARQALMRQAGLVFETCPAGIDEAAIKLDAGSRGLSAGAAALELARCKACTVDRPGALVIGCDQILVCEGAWFDKPADLASARIQLRLLRGKLHVLETATIVLRDGVVLWHCVETPSLVVRAFSEAFLDMYLAEEGERVLSSVGAYRLEGLGIQLFDRIEGDHSATLGLPLLPLLGFLRDLDMIKR